MSRRGLGPSAKRGHPRPALTCGMKPQHVIVWKPNLAACWETAPSALRPGSRKNSILLGGLASPLEQGRSGAVPAGLATRLRVDQPEHSRLGPAGYRAS